MTDSGQLMALPIAAYHRAAHRYYLGAGRRRPYRYWVFADVAAFGLGDVYRKHHPEGGKFSWWDYRGGNFHRGIGLRIDHLYATPALAEKSVTSRSVRSAFH